MTPTKIPAYPPHRVLTNGFRQAYRDRTQDGLTIALLSGFRHGQSLSQLMYRTSVPGTALTVGRLQNVAAVLRYTGPLFTDEEAVR